MELHPIIDEHLFAILINCSSRVAYLLVSLKKEEKEREKKEIRFISIERQPEEENRCYLPMLFPAADCKCQKEKVWERKRKKERGREESCLMDHLVATVDGNWTFH